MSPLVSLLTGFFENEQAKYQARAAAQAKAQETRDELFMYGQKAAIDAMYRPKDPPELYDSVRTYTANTAHNLGFISAGFHATLKDKDQLIKVNFKGPVKNPTQMVTDYNLIPKTVTDWDKIPEQVKIFNKNNVPANLDVGDLSAYDVTTPIKVKFKQDGTDYIVSAIERADLEEQEETIVEATEMSGSKIKETYGDKYQSLTDDNIYSIKLSGDKITSIENKTVAKKFSELESETVRFTKGNAPDFLQGKVSAIVADSDPENTVYKVTYKKSGTEIFVTSQEVTKPEKEDQSGMMITLGSNLNAEITGAAFEPNKKYSITKNENGKITSYEIVQAEKEETVQKRLDKKQFQELFPDYNLTGYADDTMYAVETYKKGGTEYLAKFEAQESQAAIQKRKVEETMKDAILKELADGDFKNLTDTQKAVWQNLNNEDLQTILSDPEEMLDFMQLSGMFQYEKEREGYEKDFDYIGTPNMKNVIKFRVIETGGWENSYSNIRSMIRSLTSANEEQLIALDSELKSTGSSLSENIITKIQSEGYKMLKAFELKQTEGGVDATRLAENIGLTVLKQEAKRSQFLSLLLNLNDENNIFDNLERKQVTEAYNIIQNNQDSEHKPVNESEVIAANVTEEITDEFGKISSKSVMKMSDRVYSDHKQLWTLLGLSNGTQVAKAFPDAITGDGRIFDLAAHLVEPAIGPDGNQKNPFVQYTAGKVMNKLNTTVLADRELAEVVATKLVRSNLSTSEQILALKIAMHDTNRTSGQGLDRENLEKTQKDLILAIAGVDSTDDKSVTSVRTKITDGQELLKLYNEFEKLFSGRREEALKTGFVGSIDRFFQNTFTGDGTLGQALEWFTGSSSDAINFRAEFQSEEEFNKSYEFIRTTIETQNNRGYEYGKAAALRIFIAYRMAKFFDPSGRVSDKDLQAQFDAFTGNAFSGRSEIFGMLSVAKERVTDKLDSLQLLNFDLSQVDKQTIKNLRSASLYKNIVVDKLKDKWREYETYVFNPDYDLVQPAVNDNGDIIKTTYKGDSYDVLEIVDKGSQRKKFKDFGGLFFIQVTTDTGPRMLKVAVTKPFGQNEQNIEVGEATGLTKVDWMPDSFNYRGRDGNDYESNLYQRTETDGSINYFVGYTINGNLRYEPYNLSADQQSPNVRTN